MTKKASPKKASRRVSVSDRASEIIQRTWGDVPVLDATENLRVFILPEDTVGAVRKDPGCCVFARACQRTFGATKVLFFRSVAYVELPDDAGKKRVERFTMTPGMRKLVEAFDAGKSVIPEGGFLLKAPTYSRTFEHSRAKKTAQRERQKLLGKAERKGNAGSGRYEDAPLVVDLSVRSGTGAVHFS
jgi:hypothetical protein